MTEPTLKKKLIEVALPLDAINRESAREKSIRHGHPSTLHLWWARRPLAACRAVLFAQLVDDPSAHPEEFPTDELQEAERLRLFRIIEQLVKWENSNDETVLEAARAEIRKSCGDKPPPILDPFAGGGSIPLEAQRLGLRAIASDLNPVAVLINKALIEIPPRWARHPPVHARDQAKLDNQTWHGAQGLADDIRYYGRWMRDEAERRIGHLYPKATLPDGTKATVIAWIWARTVTCPNPACGATMPLVSSFWLGKKKGKEAWVKPVIDDGQVQFEIGHEPTGPPDPPKVGRGAKFRCLVCGETAPDAHVKSEGMAGRLGAQLMAIVAEGKRQRTYLAPTAAQAAAGDVDRPADIPEEELVDDPRAIWCRLYGLLTHADLFTNRQLVALTTFSDLVGEARTRVEADATIAGLSAADAEAYADGVATYLGLAVSRTADLNNSICTWSSSRDQARNLFARQAIPMAWDFVEVNPLAGAAGDVGVSVDTAVRALGVLRARDAGYASQQDARGAAGAAGGPVILATDPPYYDNIGYADLADFFYVWLRRSLRGVYPDLLTTVLTPKAEELVATPYRFGGDRSEAEQFFRQGFVDTMHAACRSQAEGLPMSVFYAFKQSEADDGETVASTGWETMLEGLLQAGLSVTATWPIRTERAARSVSIGTNALASSIVLACRPRPEAAGITDRRGFLEALRAELPGALREMQQGSIAPVDLAQSSIGPGMGVFSRYAKVLEPSGEPMRVRAALGLINQVLDEVLSEQEGDFDAETRWAIKWFSQYGFDHGPFGDAETLCKATGTAVNGMVRSGIVESKASKVWLISRDELPADWDPATDDRVPVWEATQHLVKALDEGGEGRAAELLARLGGVGETARDLAYRLYALADGKKWAKEAGFYNALVTSWPEIRRKAAEGAPGQGSLL